MVRKRTPGRPASPARLRVDGVDRRHQGHVVVAREDRRQDDRGVRRLGRGARSTIAVMPRVMSATIASRSGDAAAAATLFVPAWSDDDLRVHAVELAVLQPPQDVLCACRRPSRNWRHSIRGSSASSSARNSRVVGRAPAARDRVADEVDVDAALARFLEQLRVREPRVRIGALDWTVRGHARRCLRRDGVAAGNAAAPSASASVSARGDDRPTG